MPKKPKSVKTFRIENEILPRLQRVSEQTGLPESWFINEALRDRLPKFEKYAEKAAKADAA